MDVNQSLQHLSHFLILSRNLNPHRIAILYSVANMQYIIAKCATTAANSQSLIAIAPS
jgi:hypothetical protein